MPRTTPSATCSGVRVPTQRGSFTPLSAKKPASLTKPGNTTVTPIPSGSHVLAQAGGEAAQAELGGRVEARARRGHLPRQRRHQHDVAAPALEHARQQRAGELDRGAQVHVDRPVDLVRVEVLDPAARREGRVGHEHVDRAGRLREPRRRVALGEVGRRPPRRARRGSSRSSSRSSSRRPVSDHRRAARVQRARDRPADASGRPRDERSGARKPHARQRILEACFAHRSASACRSPTSTSRR